MIARLWWKEARQVWPIWALLAGLGVFWMGLLRWWLDGPGALLALVQQAAFVTFVYMFLIGAAVFAGERENRTLGLLDALPVERWRVWLAKATFAAATTAALGALLWVVATAMGGRSRDADLPLLAFLLFCGFGWSLFWSTLSGNALLAAMLGMGSLALSYIQLNWGAPYMFLGLNPGALTVWHWLFAVALVPASALILHLGGPPRGFWLGARRPRLARVEPSETHIIRPQSQIVWTQAAPRLAWRAWREAWPIGWPLAVLGIGLPVAWSWSSPRPDLGPWMLGVLFVGLILGVNVFNAENRGRTQHFLAHHGARPGVVWLVNLLVGLGMAATIWLAMLGAAALLLWWRSSGEPGTRPETSPVIPPNPALFAYAAISTITTIVGAVLGVFAAGVWCGMVFRRGITAVLVSLIFWLFVCAPPIALAFSQVLWAPHLIWVPIGVLAVTWAWSGDWLLDRPGFGRWVRLALYSIATAAALSSAYVAERVWSVPTLDPAERDQIFQFDRIAAPVPPEENAADLYRQIGFSLENPRIGDGFLGFNGVIDEDWDTSAPEVLKWLDHNEGRLATLRKAAAMPVCRFDDLRNATIFSENAGGAASSRYGVALAASARVRLARGDLEGAWTDIEALLRMARQFSGLNREFIRFWGAVDEGWGLTLAMWWAADAHQTTELLRTAQASYRSLPPLPSEEDWLRVDALIGRNTARMSGEDLARNLLEREGSRISPLRKLEIDARTTPWELARLRRVYDLTSAARIRLAGGVFDHAGRYPGFDELLMNSRLSGNDWGLGSVSAIRMWAVYLTTPLEEKLRGGPLVQPLEINAAPRRALDVVFGLILWRLEHDGRLPRSLSELEAVDPEIGPSLIDPFSKSNARFGYIPSEGQSLPPLGFLRAEPEGAQTSMNRPRPTPGHMLLYSVGPDRADDRASTGLGIRNEGDIVFPIEDGVGPGE